MGGHAVIIRGRDSLSKVGGLGVHEVEGYFIHSEYIWHRLLVFNTFFMTTSNFGGLRPLIKKWGPLPPRFSASDNYKALVILILHV